MRKKAIKVNPTVTVIFSIVGILLGISGVHYIINGQGLYDILMGISLVITGFIGGLLGFLQYSHNKKSRKN
ncbi:hypothetical protein FS935_01220 [Metabacillus litoralis]|uniref:Uncharacterized protein n=1 Tax=Metabacillus litoralis TaxID=152268 RepID=A0A5C6W8T5_9BACI|nr:hypothetical protein [Metabacillus litoralis]TXC92848.1 hypothetical protein FS935_01220 [Metabacillus litoralis]